LCSLEFSPSPTLAHTHPLAHVKLFPSGLCLPAQHAHAVTHTGRQLLRDYTAGKLLHCTLPPNHPSGSNAYVPGIHDPVTLRPLPRGAGAGSSSGSLASPGSPVRGRKTPGADAASGRAISSGGGQQPQKAPSDDVAYEASGHGKDNDGSDPHSLAMAHGTLSPVCVRHRCDVRAHVGRRRLTGCA
jgi:hypothetical protein